MPDYTAPDLETDGLTLKARMVQLMQDRIPGFGLSDGHPLNFVFEGDGEIKAELLLLLSARLDEAFETFGKNLLGVPIQAATQAYSYTTWVRNDTTGARTVPAGTTLTLQGADPDTRVGFATVAEFTFADSVASTGVGEVQIIAVIAGTDGNDLQADPQPEDALAWLESITVESPTIGGDDEEDAEAYRNRLTDETQLLSRTLVTAEDYAIDARSNFDHVHRALALDLYNPADGTSNNEGMVAVAVVNEDGADPGSGVRDAGELVQQDLSVAQMTVNWIAATYTTISVAFAAKAYDDFDPDDVESRAIEALELLLSPATWGMPPFGDQIAWVDSPIVRYRDVVAAIENVEGLAYTQTVTGSVTTTNGNSNLTAVTPADGWVNGMAITGTGIPANSKILSGAGTATMVISNAAGTPVNATASATVTATGAAVTVNGGIADVTMTGPAALPTPGTITGNVSLA